MSQHMEALAEANQIRFARVGLKRAIREGDVRFAEVLLTDTPRWLEGMRIVDLLEAIWRMGPTHSSRILQKVPTHPHSHVGFLTTRQRTVLAELADEFQSRWQFKEAA